MTDFKANVGDKVELIFNNEDRITGTVTVPAISDMVRLQTLFGGDTFISLHNLKDYSILTPRAPQEPSEPKGEGYIWGYVETKNKKQAVYRTPDGVWHYEGKVGSWERLQDRFEDEPFTFKKLDSAQD